MVNTDMYIQRLLRYSIAWKGSTRADPLFSATATIPTQFSAEHLYYNRPFGSPPEANITISITLFHPVVITRCTDFRNDLSSGSALTYMKDDGTSEGALGSFKDLVNKYVQKGIPNDTMIDTVPPFWSASPEPGSTSLIGTFLHYDINYCPALNISEKDPYRISEMFTNERKESTSSCLYLLTCTVSSYWELSLDTLVENDATLMAHTSRTSVAEFGIPKYQFPITINVDGIPSFNNGNFSKMFWTPPYEPLLSIVFAGALSAVPQALVEYRDYSKVEGLLPLEFKVTQYGYGYGTSSTSVRLSLAVITTYCVITVAYISYLWITGTTSTAWNSAVEYVVLALQSKRPDHLGHTSVGIDSVNTLREGIGIRVNEDDKLELVFAHDRDIGTRNLQKIVPNKAY